MGGGELFDPVAFVDEQFVSKLTKYKDSSIAQAVLSHPHRDHISQCSALEKGSDLCPALLTCPHNKPATPEEAVDWDRFESSDALDAYKALFEGDKRNPPLQTILFDSDRTVPNLEYGIYYVRPPICDGIHSDDNQYGNATSIVFYYRHGQHTVLFPVDITPEGLRHILYEDEGTEKRCTVFDTGTVEENPDWHTTTGDQPSLWSRLNDGGLTMLLAPQNGRS